MNRPWPATGMLEPFRMIAIALLLPFLFDRVIGVIGVTH